MSATKLFPSITMLPLQPDCETWTSVQRLEHLYRMVKNLKDQDADVQMAAWLSHSDKNSCGMAACVGGYMCVDPTFMRLGIYMRRHDGPYGVGGCASNGSVEGVDAVAATLNVSLIKAMHICMPTRYRRRPITYTEVLNHIQDVIARVKEEEADAITP